MRTILTDEYIRSTHGGNLYQTIPHGVEIEHTKDQSTDPPPAGQKAVRKKAKNIKPRQQVESILIDAINGLSASGDPAKILKTAESLYLGVRREIFDVRREIETQAQEELVPLKTTVNPTQEQILNDLLDSFLTNLMEDEIMITGENISDLSLSEKQELLLERDAEDLFNEYAEQQEPRLNIGLDNANILFKKEGKLEVRLQELEDRIKMYS